MISWSRTLSVYKDFWYTYYKIIGHRQMFLLPADRADVVYTETRAVMLKDACNARKRPETWSKVPPPSALSMRALSLHARIVGRLGFRSKG